jgi:hypothetical protein
MDIDDFWREEVENARQMTPQQRLEASGELFDYACLISESGIRSQHPNADDAEVLQRLRQRIEIGAELERKDILKRSSAGGG